MKHFIKLFAIALLTSLVACSESDSEDSDLTTKKETDIISIDGTKYAITFTEDKQGNITLEKDQEEKEKIITDYFEKNTTASSYYDENDKILYLFKDSDKMLSYINNKQKINAKKNTLVEKNTSSKKVASKINSGIISLSLYEHPDYVNLMHEVNINIPFYSVREPDLSRVRIDNTSSFKNIEDKLSSVQLRVAKLYPYSTQVSAEKVEVAAVFYEDRNYGGYSFGLSLNSYDSQTYHNNLGNLRMYKSWLKGSKYFDNRISSFKMIVNNLPY